MFGLVDCNNFYCACERVFNASLDGKPVIVLSNNDGCAIARSEEAKALGIVMGTPAFMIEELLKKHDVKVFSSNYTLYGDMSDRVMKTLASFVSRLEVYSIDEAFLDMHDMAYTNLYDLGVNIRGTIKQHLGIPVCVGVAPTKTLAKMANRFAKKTKRDIGVHWASSPDDIEEMLRYTLVKDVWGIGEKHAIKLNRYGIKTAYDLSHAPADWVRTKMTVVGERLLNELKGIPSIEWEFEPKAKKNICNSRSFGTPITDKAIVREAVCNFTAVCAYKLREQKSCAREVSVFIQTNPHKAEDKQYYHSITVDIDVATNNTGELIKYVSKGFDLIYKDGYKYAKAGVVVNGLVPENSVQSSLFTAATSDKQKIVMRLKDGINKSFGRETLKVSVQGFEKKYKLRAAKLSGRYTTNINELLKVKI